MTATRVIAAGVVLGAPIVLSFFSGGFFDEPRLWAAVVTWATLGGLVAAGRIPALPRSTPARLALAGLAVLNALTALSLLWAPLAGPALDDLQRLLLYLGALALGAAALADRPGRATEPVLGLGAAVVIAYALSERLLPGIVELARSASANGRLEQPLTYWNALGSLAALGLVLCARVAADVTRERPLRAAAAAAGPVLGLGLYLTFSRGAIAAACAGLVALTLLPSERGLLAPVYLVFGAALLAALASELPGLDAVSDPGANGSTGAGLAELAILVLLAAGAAAAVLRTAPDARAPEAAGGMDRRLLTGGVVVAVAAGALALAAAGDDLGRVDSRGAERLGTVESNRYSYWGVAAGVFADRPLAGHGSGSFRVDWLRERDTPERVADAHSLYVETAAELGLLGLAALATFLAGLVLAGAAALRIAPADALGPCAVVVAWAVHVGIEWLWETPAVTLFALACAARLLALSSAAGSEREWVEHAGPHTRAGGELRV